MDEVETTDRVALSLKGLKPYIYDFYTNDPPIYDEFDHFMMEIWAEPKVVEKLLDEYKDTDAYNKKGWSDFLDSKGIRHRDVEVTTIEF